MRVSARVWVHTSDQKCGSWHLENDVMGGAGPTIVLVDSDVTRRFDSRHRVTN